VKLKQLTLANFRGFDQIDILLEDDLTVIAGVNGVGKSGVLKALATLLSHALPKFCACLEKPAALVSTDVQLGKAGLTMSCHLELAGASLKASVVRSAAVSHAEADELRGRRDTLRASARFASKRSKEALDVEDKIRQIELRLGEPADVPTVTLLPAAGVGADEYALQSAAASAQPIAVLYSTSRLLSRIGPRPPPLTEIRLSNAYNNALAQSDVSLYEFASWFRAVREGAIQSPRHAATLLALVESTLTKLVPEVSELELHTDGQPQFSIEKDGKRLFLWQLSDGEQGLLALALDLLRRLAIANPFADDPVQSGSAVVLIDEIELHLHPKWQRHVLRRLRETFRACQFVVTTHSPQVIGQVAAPKLRLLTYERGKVSLVPVAQSFGMDSSWVLQNIMGVPARDYETEQALSRIFNSIDREDLQGAREIAEKLRQEIGDFPDLQEILALVERLELLRRG
jgi:predicted ATP-binding protein involved in virulence